MSNQEQQVQIYRVTHLRRDGSKAKTRFYQSKKAFDVQRKRRLHYQSYGIRILCEILNSDGIFEEIKDE